jgi:hypothetical protein
VSDQVAAHIWTYDDRVYAVVLDEETVLVATEVDSPDPAKLGFQIETAIEEDDGGLLAAWLTEELGWGRALIVGAYFELLV